MMAQRLGEGVFDQQVAIARENVAHAGYAERVYAALLGKVIGVYVGRPFEGWSYEKIAERFGQIDRYVAHDLDKPIVVTDDDIAGTMTFIRAAQDSGVGYDTDSRDIADAWLNYVIEGRSVLWWGGLGNSTEHTAYLRLKAGDAPPASGSAALNGPIVSEQIGAQIFIDGWGLISPGAPLLAAELARRAAVVSHDGEAVFGAQVVAAMEAAAFTSTDVDDIIDAGLSVVPPQSLVARLIVDLRAWHEIEPDWRRTRELLDDRYGYHRYGGGCHIIPNHGLIILALLYCNRDFSRAMTIVNTAGWDTDCNSGNVGCLLGLIAGLDSIDAGFDWRAPVADRLYVSTADAGGGIRDVASEAHRVVAIAQAAAGLGHRAVDAPRFTFSYRGSVQGFRLLGDGALRNELLPDEEAERGLRVIADGRVEVTTPTFIPAEARSFTSYPLDASPTIYSGQKLTLSYVLDEPVADSPALADVRVTPLLRFYDETDSVITCYGDTHMVRAGRGSFSWTIPPLDAQPVCELGLAVENSRGNFYLDTVGWGGTPDTELVRAAGNGEMWRRAWVTETDFDHPDAEGGIRLISNGERRLAITGTREWSDYSVEARITPHWAEAAGLAARVRGRTRYFLLRIDRGGEAQLIRRFGSEDEIVARRPVPWRPDVAVALRIDALGDTITAYVDGVLLGAVTDSSGRLSTGAVALSCESGRVDCSSARVLPIRRV